MKKFLPVLFGALVLVLAPEPVPAQDDPDASSEAAEGSEPDAAEAEEAEDSAEDEPDADAEPSGPDESAAETESDEVPPVDEAKARIDRAEAAAGQTVDSESTPVEPEPEEIEPPAEPDVPEVDPDQPFGGSPIADLADEEFVPLEDIDEGGLEQIIPAKVHPRVEWDGAFRVRTKAMINWDLDTQGTSAILPPAESYTPQGNPADPERDTRWDANLRLKVDPTLHLTEALRVRLEIDFLDNANFGSSPTDRLGPDPITPDLSVQTGSSGQFSPREREFFANAVQVNELYGEVDTLLGKLSAGRMDDDWGLGIFSNSGDCQDCDYGTHLDRFKFETKVWELYPFASLDFPDEGLFSRVATRDGGQPYDIAQIDDVDQYNIGVFRKPVTREEKELQGRRLLDDQLPVFNGGLFYRYRKQDGRFAPLFTGSPYDPQSATGAGGRQLIYRGERIHILDLWVQFLYEPDFDTRIRVELEGITALGRVDNVTASAVGRPQETGDEALNCFDGDIFAANETRCTTDAEGNETNRNVEQFGLALESEFQFDSPVSFGLNGGFASGGSTPNWGTSGLPDLGFYRFHPDYHVDLILFRNVIGTVTNASYLNPWAMVRFLESSSRRVELQVDGIGSRALKQAGTPSGNASWLGLEFDAAVRYVNLDIFTAAIEGGILFPFRGLSAVTDRPRYVQFGQAPPDFNADQSARIAWTVQGKLFWNF